MSVSACPIRKCQIRKQKTLNVKLEPHCWLKYPNANNSPSLHMKTGCGCCNTRKAMHEWICHITMVS